MQKEVWYHVVSDAFINNLNETSKMAVYQQGPVYNQQHLNECRSYFLGGSNGFTSEVNSSYRYEEFPKQKLEHKSDKEDHRPAAGILALSKAKDEALELEHRAETNVTLVIQRQKKFLETTL